WMRFFFFQAEDGIRDRTVTGVQTCALPIFAAAARRMPTFCEKPPALALDEVAAMQDAIALAGIFFQMGFMRGSTPATRPRRSRRSEEGRVGKECRVSWIR